MFCLSKVVGLKVLSSLVANTASNPVLTADDLYSEQVFRLSILCFISLYWPGSSISLLSTSP